jgi:urease accessory protein
MRGSLNLTFAINGSRQTRLTKRTHEPPLQVIRDFAQPDGAALVHLHNTSGGILGGDHLSLSVDVGPDAQAQLTTTSATRLYRSDITATQITEVVVGEGGLLEYLPDPVIPFAGSRYRQETRIALAPDAGLFWWETLTPGRAARGELFAYDCLELNLDLTAGNRPVAVERVRLEPAQHLLSSPARFGPYRFLTTFYVCHVGLSPAQWRALEEQLSQEADARSRPGEILWGVSTLPAHGLSIRGLSTTGRELSTGLLAFWCAAKRELYGREAILPRKVY